MRQPAVAAGEGAASDAHPPSPCAQLHRRNQGRLEPAACGHGRRDAQRRGIAAVVQAGFATPGV